MNTSSPEKVCLKGLVHRFWHVLKFVIKCFKLININIRTKELHYKNKNTSKKGKKLTTPGLEPLTHGVKAKRRNHSAIRLHVCMCVIQSLCSGRR